MKKFLILIFVIILIIIPTVYAESYDTNIVGGTGSSGTSGGKGADNSNRYWAKFNTTGTRYVIRIYDWNSGKYIPIPKEYYINHIYKTKKDGTADTKMQYMYLGVNKTKTTNASGHEIVRSGKEIFTDNTYTHILKWFDNDLVKNFGVTKNDVNLLAFFVEKLYNFGEK